MKLSFVQPRAELRPYVKSIWICKSEAGMPISGNNIAAPNGCPKIIINIENSIISTAGGVTYKSKEHEIYFAGSRDIPVQITTSSRKTIFIGIEFYPHGAYPIFGIPSFEITNSLLPVNIIWERGEKNLSEIFWNKEGLKDKIDFIQERLVNNLTEKPRDNLLIEYCIKTLSSSNGLMEISRLEQMTGYSRRYLEILFKIHVGFTPKSLAGIFRFQKFYSAWASGKSYSDLVYDLNNYYFDQSHFIKEFKRMTGFSPKHFSNKISNEFGRQLTLH